MSITTILVIGSGGFIGAILRAYLIGVVNSHIEHDIPFGTLVVNVVGSFIMGFLYFFFTHTHFFPPHVKSFLSTGILGALTTYSTFAIETFILFNDKTYMLAFSNMLLNLFGSIIAVFSGYYIAKELLALYSAI